MAVEAVILHPADNSAVAVTDLPEGKGIWYMNTPGNDMMSVTGLAAGGAIS